MAARVSTLRELEEHYLGWLQTEVDAGRAKARTLAYYRGQLGPWIKEVGGESQVLTLIAWDLECRKLSWHRVQAVQRLFNWGVAVGLVERNPFAGLKRPRYGERQLILDRRQLLQLLRACNRPLRDLLQGQRLMLARPQEPRGLRWSDYREDLSAFLLDEFKGKRLRADQARVRILPIAARLARLLGRLRRRSPATDGFVFLNNRKRPWTASTISHAVRRVCRRLGLDVEKRERIVAYTLRHTAATTAIANGVSDRMLAELMGHASTRTTARYQHLTTDHLRRGIEAATAKEPPRPEGPPRLGLVG